VLAGDVMHIERGLADKLVGIVELVRLREMGDVAGVDHKGGLGRHSLDLGDRVTQRAERIWVSGLVETDVTVADLEEGESRSFSGKGVAEEAVAEKAQGFRHAARQSPQHASAGPDYAFECTPSG
jgi:hypothetical protein